MAEEYNIGVEAKKLVCPRCEAKPSEDCKTISGQKTDLHAARWKPLGAAYDAGWHAGYVIGKEG
jgi:hypothetical protein